MANSFLTEKLNLFNLCVVVGTIAVMSSPALPHSWYDYECCSHKDCFPIPIDSVEETAIGWHVRYSSPEFGNIDEDFPRGKERHSQDGRFHMCPKAVQWKPRIRCFYAPVNT